MPGGRRKKPSPQRFQIADSPQIRPQQPPRPPALVANVRRPPPINVHGDRAEEWQLFDQQFSWYSAATSLTSQPENVQIAVFMSSIGPEAVEEFNSLKLSEEDQDSLAQIRLALKTRFAPRTNYRFERYQFNKLLQETDEKFDKFLTRVVTRANVVSLAS